MEEQLKNTVVEIGSKAGESLQKYFEGGKVEGKKVDRALKMMYIATKVIHMNQTRTLVQQGQALRLLPYLANKEIREEYIKITNPVAGKVMAGKEVEEVEDNEESDLNKTPENEIHPTNGATKFGEFKINSGW